MHISGNGCANHAESRRRIRAHRRGLKNPESISLWTQLLSDRVSEQQITEEIHTYTRHPQTNKVIQIKVNYYPQGLEQEKDGIANSSPSPHGVQFRLFRLEPRTHRMLCFFWRTLSPGCHAANHQEHRGWYYWPKTPDSISLQEQSVHRDTHTGSISDLLNCKSLSKDL